MLRLVQPGEFILSPRFASSSGLLVHIDLVVLIGPKWHVHVVWRLGGGNSAVLFDRL
jgi:hypothetical protein